MIYADYNGSAPICGDVKDYLIKRLEKGPYANPNAIHHLGQKILMGMENARSVCAKAIDCERPQIIFNSGATEGISTVFHSVCLQAKKQKRLKIITSGIEHSAIHNLCKFYEEEGFEILKTGVTCDGMIEPESLEKLLKDNPGEIALVCLMAANNETGVIQPYKEFARLCTEYKAIFLCDTTQIIGKAPFSFKECGADYAVLSGHKIGALTGSGFLMARDPDSLTPLIIGGGQEKGHRGGTQNYLGNETLAVALQYVCKNFAKIEELRKARENFEAKLKKRFPTVVILGENAERLATTTYIAFPGIHGQAVQIELESQDIFVTTSSACSDNQPVTSKVLKAMGVTDDVGRGVVRISLGLCATPSTYDTIFEALSKAYEKLGKIKSF